LETEQPSLTIGAATTYSPIMEVNAFPPDGMLGLAFQQISKYSGSPLFETLVNEKKKTYTQVTSIIPMSLWWDSGWWS